MFLLGASCEPERVPDVLRGLMHQVYEPALTCGDHELVVAKTRIISHFVHARETYQGIADQLGRSALVYGDPNYGAHYIAAIEALTPDDLYQAAAACLIRSAPISPCSYQPGAHCPTAPRSSPGPSQSRGTAHAICPRLRPLSR